MTNFDWRTDEERGWDQPVGTPAPSPDEQSRWRRVLRAMRRHWRAYVTGLLLFAALSALGVRVATLRVQQAEATAREELNAALNVLFDAAARQDEELFLTLLGGDRSWRQAQLETFEQRSFFRRDALGLTWQTQVEPASEIRLSPDLQKALITATLRYEGYAGADAPRMFGLQHVLRYERKGAQWRLTPHEDDRGAGWATSAGRNRLQAVYPRQNAQLGQRLTEDMRAALQTVCETMVDCPAALELHVRFALMPGTLHTPSLATNGARRNRLSLYLPAPGLVGLPVDETGYAALRNAYLRTMLNRLLTSLVWRDVGPDSAFHSALRRQLYVDLDLMAWPPVDIAEPSADNPDMGDDVLALCATNVNQGASLLRYDAARHAWSTELEGRNFIRLVGLQEAPGALLREQRSPFDSPQSRVMWWAEGQERLFFDDYYLGDTVPSSPAFIAGTPDGQGRWIYLGHAANCNGRTCSDVVIRDEPTAWSPDGRHTLLLRELQGSRSPPAGDDVLWLGDGSGQTLQRLDDGFYPFWIDNETFGYLVIPSGSPQSFPFDYELVVRRLQAGGELSDPQSVPLRMREALQRWAPDAPSVQDIGIAINHIIAHPSRPQTIYITAVRFSDLVSSAARPQSSIYLFEADTASGEVTVRIPSAQMQWTTLPRLSTDGRFLAYISYDPQNGEGRVAVHDLLADVSEGDVYERRFHSSTADPFYGPDAYPSVDWSQRGGDLLVLDVGILRVVDPQTATEQTIVPPTPACSHAAWAD